MIAISTFVNIVDTARRLGSKSTSVPERQFALYATVVGGCRLESSDLNTAPTRIGLLAQAKEGRVAWLEHSVQFPVVGASQELALELPRTTAKIQVSYSSAGERARRLVSKCSFLGT